ncbi:aminoglycoside phosphotransferase family protein [Kitasatospora sp. GP82]|uniref:aminoglycoside phosphotransferase family protein n=1 Tax=Kitasatospora sp. GP82 TaxID=3035089 RepID=UPI002475D51C|nr:aminoglycoside phosphotransferase family protein [Kitasatospora sp. GP82]MDH6128600.1 streptomycin 6-kinase [Kitasatospora sp. GP82]
MSAAPGQFTVPERLAQTVRATEGAAGAAWLAGLRNTVAEHLARWDLTLERIGEPGGRLSLIAYVRRPDDSLAVLKAQPVTPATAHEHAALAHWAGRSAVLLLDADPAAGVLLLERLHGDIPLRSLAEAKAMLEATSLLQRLWVPPAEGHPFSSVADRVGELASGLRRRRELPRAADTRPLIDEALETAAGLLADEPERRLLHGDFHHGNVLAADRAPWLAVNPEPLVGERAFDLAWLAQDRMDTLAGSPGPRGAARRRLHQLADSVEVEYERLRGWTLFRTVAAGLRCLEAGDTEGTELYLEFASWL